MKVATSYAIATLVTDKELSEDYVIPSALDPRVAHAVAEAVKKPPKKAALPVYNTKVR